MNNRFKRVTKRTLFYVRQGASLVTLILVFFGLSENIYNFLKIFQVTVIFPNLKMFQIFGMIPTMILCGLIGYVYMKRSWLFREAVQVQTEANPYTQRKIVPVSLPLYKVMSNLAREHGIDTTELDRQIRESEEQ